MFQLRKRELKQNPEKLTGAAPDKPLAKTLGGERTLLRWGEHCTECAAPACYSSCSFYSPSLSLKCRRFDNGIEPVEFSDGAIGFRFRMRKWGKLEAKFDPRTVAMADAAAIERRYLTLGRAADSFAPSDRFRNRTFAMVEKTIGRRIDNKRGQAALTGFALEAENLGEAVSVNLVMKSRDPQVRALFQKTIELAPGYNRIVVPIAEISGSIQIDSDTLIQIIPASENYPLALTVSFLDFITQETAEQPQSAPASATTSTSGVTTRKLLAWDLDNTLWKGTLIEDGLEKLVLNPVAVAAIIELDRRGILNSIASKNNHDDAIEAIRHFGLEQYFLYPQINWGPKSESLKRIAKNLNIGIDSFAFIDDQPFERAEVSENTDGVVVLEHTSIDELLSLPLFNAPVTAEARKRRLMYLEEMSRKQIEQESGGDIVAFLKTCAIKLTVDPINEANVDRVFELAQRTNQLNYSGRKMTRTEVDVLAEGRGDLVPYVLSCDDRFGAYGIIGFCSYDKSRALVDNFFMSCRVQHKLVDHAFFGMLVRDARETGHSELRVRFTPTAKNTPSRLALEEMGFDFGEEGLCTLPLDRGVTNDQVVSVVRTH